MSADIDQFILDYKRHALEERKVPQRLPHIIPTPNQQIQQPIQPIQYVFQPPKQLPKSYPARLSTPEKPLVERLTEGELRHRKFVEERKRDLQQELNSSRRPKSRGFYSQSDDEKTWDNITPRYDNTSLQKKQEERNREYNQFIKMEAEKFRNRFLDKKYPTFSNELPIQLPRRLPSLFQSSTLNPVASSSMQSITSSPRLKITSLADELLRQVRDLRSNSSKSQLQSKYYFGSLPHLSSLNENFDKFDLKLSVPRSFRILDTPRGSDLRPLSDLGSSRLNRVSKDWNEDQIDLLYKRNNSFPQSDRRIEPSLNSSLLYSDLDKLAEFERKLKDLDLLFDQQKSTPRNPRSSSLESRPIQTEERSLATIFGREDNDEIRRKRQEDYRRELEQQIKEKHQMKALEMNDRNDLQEIPRNQYSRNDVTNNQFSPRNSRKDIFRLTQVENNIPGVNGLKSNTKLDNGPASSRGMIFSSDEDRKEAQRRQQEKFSMELSAQIEERKRERERQQREQDEYDRRKAEEIAKYKPFGKEGGGAPSKTSARRTEEEEPKSELTPLSRFTQHSPRNKQLGDVSPEMQTKHSEAAKEQGHARGGHGIFGEALTESQKTVADQYKEDLRKQIEEKKRREEIEKQREIETEKREMKRLQGEQIKAEREKEEEEKKKREREKAFQQENNQHRAKRVNEVKLKIEEAGSRFSSQSVELHEDSNELSQTNRSTNVNDREDALHSLKIMKQKLDSELRRTAGSLLTLDLNSDDYMPSNRNAHVKRQPKTVKEKPLILPLSTAALNSSPDIPDMDKRSMDTTTAEMIVNDFIGNTSRSSQLQPTDRHHHSVQRKSPQFERRSSEQSILLDSESAFLQFSQPLRQNLSGESNRAAIPLEDWESQRNLNDLARKNDERRQRLRQMQEESQICTDSDPEKVLSQFLLRHNNLGVDSNQPDGQEWSVQDNPTNNFDSSRTLLQSSGSLYSQLVNESEMHPIDSFNHQIFQLT